MDTAIEHPADRVRRHTSDSAARAIDTGIRSNVREHGSRSSFELGQRIAELEREWDIERTLEANAATLALTGAVLGTTVHRRWFWLTGGVLTFLLLHATSGWCPPIPILRRLGIRTQNEIDREKFALKAVRGDFDSDFDADTGSRPSVVRTLHAVNERDPRPATDSQREPDRVRRYTSKARRRIIDVRMAQRVRLYATESPDVISQRIEELRREWSVERYLQINVAAVGLTTAAVAWTSDRKWGWATCAGLAFFLFHAVEGFDPPLPALRRMGVRTRAEINREIYALKVLRGDFDAVFETHDARARIEAALAAVEVDERDGMPQPAATSHA